MVNDTFPLMEFRCEIDRIRPFSSCMVLEVVTANARPSTDFRRFISDLPEIPVEGLEYALPWRCRQLRRRIPDELDEPWHSFETDPSLVTTTMRLAQSPAELPYPDDGGFRPGGPHVGRFRSGIGVHRAATVVRFAREVPHVAREVTRGRVGDVEGEVRRPTVTQRAHDDRAPLRLALRDRQRRQRRIDRPIGFGASIEPGIRRNRRAIDPVPASREGGLGPQVLDRLADVARHEGELFDTRTAIVGGDRKRAGVVQCSSRLRVFLQLRGPYL